MPSIIVDYDFVGVSPMTGPLIILNTQMDLVKDNVTNEFTTIFYRKRRDSL